MTRYYVHYMDWHDAPPWIRFFRLDVLQHRPLTWRARIVGVAFALRQGRLTAAHLTVRGKHGNTVQLPLSEQEACALVPLSARQALWDEAVEMEAKWGVIADD